MIFKILGIIIFCLFYGIYFAKMLMQRAKGIQTDQMARGKKPWRLFLVELLLKTATYLLGMVEIFSLLSGFDSLPPGLRCVGLALAFAGVACFGVSVFTMKDSWRAGIPKEDKTEIVTEGIYSYSRNPAFLGFDMVYTGLMLMFYNPALLAFTAFAVLMLHLQILQEEKFMEDAFGDKYREYKRHVCRYVGRKREI